MWTREAIWNREVEAQETCLALPNTELRMLKAGWPDIRRDFADAVAAEETRVEEGFPWDPSWTKRGAPNSRAIDRMHEVWAWHTRFLANEPMACRILQAMALSKAKGKPLPQYFLVNQADGKTLASGDMPPTPAEFLATIKKAGG